jgi:hypothetical protein
MYTTIKKPSDYFNTKLYTGNGASGSTQAITGVGFQPDLVWIKSRTTTARHALQDVIRGTGDHKLSTNETQYEGFDENDWAGGYISSFDNDGFTANGGTSNASIVNNSGVNYASWNWKANGAGSANTDGSITSTVSANTTSGFSIVKFTGTGANATVGHGLGSAPKFIFGKNASVGTSAWAVYSSVLGGTKYLNINTNSGEGTFSGYWNNTNPTSSLISIGSHGDVNGVGDNMIYYCFSDVKGFSKMGSYTGNGNADGSFIYTGFKPAFVMIKRTDSANDWFLQDNKRLGYNAVNYYLEANTNLAEQSNSDIDILSNGFKCRSNGGGHNNSGGTYIYMAIAEEPLVGDNPATAR